MAKVTTINQSLGSRIAEGLSNAVQAGVNTYTRVQNAETQKAFLEQRKEQLEEQRKKAKAQQAVIANKQLQDKLDQAIHSGDVKQWENIHGEDVKRLIEMSGSSMTYSGFMGLASNSSESAKRISTDFNMNYKKAVGFMGQKPEEVDMGSLTKTVAALEEKAGEMMQFANSEGKKYYMEQVKHARSLQEKIYTERSKLGLQAEKNKALQLKQEQKQAAIDEKKLTARLSDFRQNNKDQIDRLSSVAQVNALLDAKTAEGKPTPAAVNAVKRLILKMVGEVRPTDYDVADLSPDPSVKASLDRFYAAKKEGEAYVPDINEFKMLAAYLTKGAELDLARSVDSYMGGYEGTFGVSNEEFRERIKKLAGIKNADTKNVPPRRTPEQVREEILNQGKTPPKQAAKQITEEDINNMSEEELNAYLAGEM